MTKRVIIPSRNLKNIEWVSFTYAFSSRTNVSELLTAAVEMKRAEAMKKRTVML